MISLAVAVDDVDGLDRESVRFGERWKQSRPEGHKAAVELIRSRGRSKNDCPRVTRVCAVCSGRPAGTGWWPPTDTWISQDFSRLSSPFRLADLGGWRIFFFCCRACETVPPLPAEELPSACPAHHVDTHFTQRHRLRHEQWCQKRCQNRKHLPHETHLTIFFLGGNDGRLIQWIAFDRSRPSYLCRPVMSRSLLLSPFLPKLFQPSRNANAAVITSGL